MLSRDRQIDSQVNNQERQDVIQVTVQDSTQNVHQRVSARDKILREVVSNSLAHRDYSSGFVSKFIIEANRIYLENPNRANGYGILQLSNFSPYPKNPAISKVFREMGLADELGSGMRNTYKYTKLYSGGIPEFCEGDMFKITIPLKQTIEQVTGQDTEQKSRQISGQMSGQIIHEKSVADIERSILTFCKKPKSRKEIHEYISQFSKSNIIKSYINPLLKKGKLIMTIPDKPHSKNQKYITKSVRKK